MNVAYNMDCMEYMRTLPDKAFDLAVVDPPYRDAAENAPTKDMRRNGTLACFGDKPTKEYFEELQRVSKEQIIWGANNFELPPYKGFLVWEKLTISEGFTMSQAEIAAISEGLGTTSKIFKHMPQGAKGDPRIHPTQKPVALYAWIFSRYAKRGEKILDTHLGSGSSRIAAYDAGLDFVGCEIDKDYFKAQEVRFAAHAAQLTMWG
jgi:site-specific DNA-methyltransferase (adenine-specific)|nr:MAG TPA_asm: adenine specific DNA methyltransferase [Bacteriophage sp.]